MATRELEEEDRRTHKSGGLECASMKKHSRYFINKVEDKKPLLKLSPDLHMHTVALDMQ